jgi:hypothetical protein
MSRGKYLSLEEARKSGELERFVKEHPSEADVNWPKAFFFHQQALARARPRLAPRQFVKPKGDRSFSAQPAFQKVRR